MSYKTIKVLICVLLWVFLSLIGIAKEAGFSAKDQGEVQNLLQRSLSDGQAIVWYLGHCGYAVKTKSHLLVFDYTEQLMTRGGPPIVVPAVRSLNNGWIDPQEIRDLDVVVFVSHSHGDHYDPAVIDKWVKDIPKIRYVYGWSEKSDAVHFSLSALRAEFKLPDLEVTTINSHHSGVPESSFLVKVDGLVFYHNGDYIGKMSENGPFMVDQDVAYLQTKTKGIDLMFIASSDFEPFIKLINGLKPKLIFPMHYGNIEEKYQEYPPALKRKGIVFPVQLPSKRGDCFLYPKVMGGDHE